MYTDLHFEDQVKIAKRMSKSIYVTYYFAIFSERGGQMFGLYPLSPSLYKLQRYQILPSIC